MLRSVKELKDFIVEDEDWQIQHMVIDASNLSDSDKQVLVALEWTKGSTLPGKRSS